MSHSVPAPDLWPQKPFSYQQVYLESNSFRLSPPPLVQLQWSSLFFVGLSPLCGKEPSVLSLKALGLAAWQGQCFLMDNSTVCFC